MVKTHCRHVPSGVPAVLSHKAGEVAFIPCSLPRRGQLPPPAALLKVELRPDIPLVQLPLQPACTTAPAAHIAPCGYVSTSLPRTYLYCLLLYLWWVYVTSTSPSNLILITLLQFLCHRDAHLDFSETAQNDPMVKGLQTSFLRKVQRPQQIKAWLGFRVQGLGTAWIIFFSLAVSVPK